TATDRPDLVARVFELKKKALIKDIDNGALGVRIARIHVIEFQKRGLPHMHLLVTLHDKDKPKTAGIIDQLVWAEIPDANKYPKLRTVILKHMIHGPCGLTINANSPCMENGKCTKEF